MPNRRRSRGRNRSNGNRYLAVVLLLTALLVAGGILLQSGAFSIVSLGRAGNVDIVNDGDGAVTFTLNHCLRDKNTDNLLSVTNRLGVTATYTVSLDQSSYGELVTGGGSGDSVSFTLIQGGSQSVDMAVNITGPYPKVATFDIDAEGPGVQFHADRSTLLDKKNGCGGIPTPTVGTPPPGNLPPNAQFNYQRQNKNKIDLDGTPSNDPDGTVVSWEWDVGNDGTIDYTGQTVGNADVPEGTPVKLTVTDNHGATDTIVKTVNGGATPQPTPTPPPPTVSPGPPTPTPTNQPPVAQYTYARQNQNKADLDASGSYDPDGSIVTYEWDIGNDGSIDYTGQTVNNANVGEGVAVTLIVTDNDGATGSVTQTVV